MGILIDRDKTREAMCKDCGCCNGEENSWCVDVRTIMDMTVVREEVSWRWHPVNWSKKHYYCTKCGKYSEFERPFSFCPHCGSPMDGVCTDCLEDCESCEGKYSCIYRKEAMTEKQEEDNKNLEEDGIQWHDLRKNPYDLPDYNMACCYVTKDGSRYAADGCVIRMKNDDIILWCEFPKYRNIAVRW